MQASECTTINQRLSFIACSRDLKTNPFFEMAVIDLARLLCNKNGDKVWIVLYTCGMYPTYLEMDFSLSTENFLLSLRQCIARRIRLPVNCTDNDTNSRGTFIELCSSDQTKIACEAFLQHIFETFIIPVLVGKVAVGRDE